MSNFTPDYRVYATVLYSDNSLQYRSTVLVNIIATPLNLLFLYCVLFKSKHEKMKFKLCMFAYHFTFYCCQMQLGVFGGMVILYPFPASYSQGLLSNYFSTFTLFLIWVFFFCSFGYSAFFIQINRLQVVARHGMCFDFRKSTYFTICIVFAIFVYVPFPSILYLSYSTPEEQAEFVRTKYPNNLEVLKRPGLYVLTKMTNVILNVMILSVLGMFLVLSIILFGIYWETRVDRKRKSSRNIRERVKGIQHFMAQTIFMSSFICISAGLTLKSFFNDPSVDSRLSNTIAFSCLCGASIPAQLLGIYRNTAYREFVFGRGREASVVAIPEVSAHVNHRVSIAPHT